MDKVARSVAVKLSANPGKLKNHSALPGAAAVRMTSWTQKGNKHGANCTVNASETDSEWLCSLQEKPEALEGHMLSLLLKSLRETKFPWETGFAT
eukprot:1800511-Amphidinium_carterae.2